MNATPQAPGQNPRVPNPLVSEARELLTLCTQGAEANDRDDLIRKLTAARTNLNHDPSPATVRAAATEVIRALESLKIDLRTRRTQLADPGRAARLRAELDRARSHFDGFQTRSREWPSILGEGFAGLTSDADFALRTKARAVIADAEERIDAGDPKRTAEEFGRWLRDRLAIEADDIYAMLLDNARRIAGLVGAQLEAPAHDIRSVPVVAPQRLVAELPVRKGSAGSSTPGASKMLGILMPTYGGIMMAVVASRFLGLALPGWVIAVMAGVGAAALGGTALMGERKRQLDRRRNEAKSAMRATVDEYQLAMSKQIRDAARFMQHDLRKSATAAVGERAAAMTAQLDEARESADRARTTSADLKDISDDLDSVDQLQQRAKRLMAAPSGRNDGEPPAERILRPVV